jgi:hypothetical protein
VTAGGTAVLAGLALKAKLLDPRKAPGGNSNAR